MLACVLLACSSPAVALNPALDISQYAHTVWTIRDGFFEGVIHAIAQTPDGYLWLGTEFGLVRFDGVRSVPFTPPPGEQLASNNIQSLAVTRDGRLWIATTKGLASWKDGKLIHYPEFAGQYLTALLEDRGGTVWVGLNTFPAGGLCSIQRGRVECYGQDGSVGRVFALYEDRAGNLWAGGPIGASRWKPGPPTHYPWPDTENPVQGLIEGDDGELLIAVGVGIKQLVEGKLKPYALPGSAQQLEPTRFLRDRNGSLWIGTAQNRLFHVHQGRTDVFSESDGFAGLATRLFEDREGTVWVSGVDGLHRFRDYAVPTMSGKQGLSHAYAWSVTAAEDGSVWLGTRDGLNRWHDGRVTIYRKQSGLHDDLVQSLYRDDRGRVWASTVGRDRPDDSGRQGVRGGARASPRVVVWERDGRSLAAIRIKAIV